MPINVIIGRNNSGKSHLLDLIAAVCEDKLGKKDCEYKCQTILKEALLKTVFREDVSGGPLMGNHWQNHGKYLVDLSLTWELDRNLNPSNLTFSDPVQAAAPEGEMYVDRRIARLRDSIKHVTHKLSGTAFRRLLADRDIRTEPSNPKVWLAPDGNGACNDGSTHLETLPN